MGAVQGVEVAGTGFYVPAQVVTNEDYEERYGVSAAWEALNSKTPTRLILMGDGAGACGLERRAGAAGILAQYFHSDGARWDADTIQGGGTRHPNPLEIDRSEIEKLYFKMDGQKIFKFGVLSLNESIDELLKRSGLGPEDIDLVIPHQANLRILDLALRRSRIPPERFFTNLAT